MVVVVVLVDGVVTHRRTGPEKAAKAAKVVNAVKAVKAAKAATQQHSMISAGIAASRDTAKPTAGRRSEMATAAAGAVLLVTSLPSTV